MKTSQESKVYYPDDLDTRDINESDHHDYYLTHLYMKIFRHKLLSVNLDDEISYYDFLQAMLYNEEVFIAMTNPKFRVGNEKDLESIRSTLVGALLDTLSFNENLFGDNTIQQILQNNDIDFTSFYELVLGFYITTYGKNAMNRESMDLELISSFDHLFRDPHVMSNRYMLEKLQRFIESLKNHSCYLSQEFNNYYYYLMYLLDKKLDREEYLRLFALYKSKTLYMDDIIYLEKVIAKCIKDIRNINCILNDLLNEENKIFFLLPPTRRIRTSNIGRIRKLIKKYITEQHSLAFCLIYTHHYSLISLDDEYDFLSFTIALFDCNTFNTSRLKLLFILYVLPKIRRFNSILLIITHDIKLYKYFPILTLSENEMYEIRTSIINKLQHDIMALMDSFIPPSGAPIYNLNNLFQWCHNKLQHDANYFKHDLYLSRMLYDLIKHLDFFIIGYLQKKGCIEIITEEFNDERRN